jgi:hypothetical protein
MSWETSDITDAGGMYKASFGNMIDGTVYDDGMRGFTKAVNVGAASAEAGYGGRPRTTTDLLQRVLLRGAQRTLLLTRQTTPEKQQVLTSSICGSLVELLVLLRQLVRTSTTLCKKR